MKALVVDDETLTRDLIKVLIKENCPDWQIVGEAANIRDADLCIAKQTPDVIFLDVEMPLGTGFELIGKKLPNPSKVVMVTAHEKYAIKALRTGVFDYLLKPIDEIEFIFCNQKTLSFERIKQGVCAAN